MCPLSRARSLMAHREAYSSSVLYQIGEKYNLGHNSVQATTVNFLKTFILQLAPNFYSYLLNIWC